LGHALWNSAASVARVAGRAATSMVAADLVNVIII